jgi:Asp-tRNA(Asn)/Glu-tRNA(Gln) amidotransferase B subunit
MKSSDKLKELANSFGKKTEKSNVLGTGLTFHLNDYKGFKVKLYSTPQTIKVDIKTDSSITVSFHQPDSICLINQPLALEYPTTVFTSTADNKQQVIEFASKVRPVIDWLNLRHSESLTIYKNQISAELYPDRDFNATCDRLLELIRLNYKRDEKKIEELNDLPDNLRELYSLFDKYSISDDQERDELIGSLTKKEIKGLIEKVDKRTHEINNFLNSFMDTQLTENAEKLMSLTELVMELKNAPQQKL